ncbi:hypothetical protein [Nocardiopsis dassonvillei]|uniref:hypothetical protein n=1 Tax=Nocardiopsis dassonvillei TaxID=2014 RepID=UPI00366ECBD1
MSTGAKIGIGCGGCLGVSILGFVFLIILGAIVGSDSNTGTDTTTAASPEAAGESSAPEEAAAEEEPVEEETSGVTMTATSAGTVGDSVDDTVYTAIDIVIVNDSEESVDVNPINFNAILADGTVVSDWADTIFADIDPIDTVTLQPGQRAEGQIAVVGEVDVASVEMADLFGMDDPVVAEVQ